MDKLHIFTIFQSIPAFYAWGATLEVAPIMLEASGIVLFTGAGAPKASPGGRLLECP